MRIAKEPQFIFVFLLFFVNKNVSVAFSPDDNLTIELPQGNVRGIYDWIGNQRKFLGIPYASVTERFAVSGSTPSWNGTLDANRGNIRCNQYFSTLEKPVGQEDCLVLNIFTPVSTYNSLPVMVFIHGGGYYWGSNSDLIYNPRYFVKEKVIFVTINYRLGAFGFLCLGIKEAPGNIGLKDQLAALKWIQNNIVYFGGDPNSVTLVGESVGAASVNYFLVTHSADGLFHRAIMQSGSILMPQAFSYNPVKSASGVARRLGYKTANPKELLNIFKNSSADDIIKASHVDGTNNLLAPYIFRPCKETAITNDRPLITKTPKELLKQIGLNISVITGFNNKEGIYWATNYEPQTLDELEDRFDTIIPDNLHFENDDDKKMFKEAVLTIYFENRTVSDGLIEYFTDSLIAYQCTIMSKSFVTKPDRTVHNYYFKYDSIRNLNKFLTRLRFTPGACHGDELFYMFDPVIYSVVPSTAKDLSVIKTMTKLWTNFATAGLPAKMDYWYASGEQLNFLEIDSTNKMIPLPNKARMQFWINIFEKYGKR